MGLMSLALQTWVRTQIGTEIYWIGLNDIAAEGVWEWTDGNVYYPYLANWRPGQPDNWGDNEDCGEVVGASHGQWNDEPCLVRRRYICKRPNRTFTLPPRRDLIRIPSNPPTLCDTANGWQQYGSSCYRLKADTRRTWAAARIDCVREGGDLVSIENAAEEQYVTGRLDPSSFDLWIGYSTLSCTTISCQVQPDNTQFHWSDASTYTYTNWGENQPDLSFSGNCYWVVSNINLLTSWHEAHTKCSAMGAGLVTIKSEEEQFFINAQLPDLHQVDVPDVWIGVSGNYHGKWETTNCFKNLGYICKMVGGQNVKPTAAPDSHCDAGYLLYGDHCYHFETETVKNWDDAQAYCINQNGNLASVHSQEEMSILTAHMTRSSWVGLNDKASEGNFVWSDGTPTDFLLWDNNQPDNWQGNEDCVQVRGVDHSNPGHFNDQFCTSTFPFICKKGWNEKCGSWVSDPFNDYCYLFNYLSIRKWADARADCLNQGGDLLSITEPFEQGFIQAQVQQIPTGVAMWMGGHDSISEGGWEWSDGSPFRYTNWGPGEPNNHEGREDCVEMVSTVNGSSWWNDLNCDAHQDWICMIAKGKKPIIPPTAPPPVPAPDCGSNPGWRKKNGICYYYNDTDIVDFHTAMERCYVEKARLVSIANKDEQAVVSSMVGTGQVSAAWIGMMMFGVAEGEYIWVDHSPVTYVHWAGGEPNNANGEEQCVQMNRYPGWKLFRNKCYMFKGDHKNENEVRANWSFARDWCRNQGGDLAVIDNQYENDFVSSYLRDLVLPAWIGLSDTLHEGKFAWSDGSPVKYTNWADKEPNNGDEGEHCATMTHSHLVTGRWNDDSCHLARGWVCYRKKSSSIPEPPPTKNPCPSGYTSWYNNCYKLVEEYKTWEEAQAACQQEKGNLASIDQSYDQAFVAGVVLQGKSDAWIGLRRKDGSGSYAWTDGWPVFFTHWGPGEPTSHEGEGCVSMHASPHLHGVWNDTACGSAKHYICKTSSDKPPATPAPGDGKCLPGWWPYGRYCYFVYNGKTGFSWPESRHYCQLAQGDLVSIHSRAEVEFIRKINYTKYHNVWIGLTRDQSFGWAWTDGTALAFLNWAPGEPNEAFHPGDVGRENCVEMYHDGKWNDNNCVQKRGFACRHRQSDNVFALSQFVSRGCVA
ncbi:C-type mannose receptor 2 [Megalops cyprinoides]|uniref:C-type mannose receptor 2 n=1 Tax=Megalops cyprinoides TaxID=118141 RepID=UPI0018644A4C|nr:C-type mannose receptor 2 [Megalops cyprinoides]